MTSYTTLANVRNWLTGIQVQQISDDALISSLIDSVSDCIDVHLGRGILAQTATETQNGTNTQSIFVRNYPITSVSSVIVNDYSYPPSPNTMTPGFVNDETRIYLRSGTFTRGIQNIVVTYTGGYDQIPSDIVQAATELVVWKYKGRNHIGMASHSTNGVTTDSFLKDIPREITCVLEKYKRVTYQ